MLKKYFGVGYTRKTRWRAIGLDCPSVITVPRSALILSLVLSPRSLFALLSKKHNKVLEQATQSLRGRTGDNNALPDYVSHTHTHTHTRARAHTRTHTREVVRFPTICSAGLWEHLSKKCTNFISMDANIFICLCHFRIYKYIRFFSLFLK